MFNLGSESPGQVHGKGESIFIEIALCLCGNSQLPSSPVIVIVTADKLSGECARELSLSRSRPVSLSPSSLCFSLSLSLSPSLSLSLSRNFLTFVRVNFLTYLITGTRVIDGSFTCLLASCIRFSPRIPFSFCVSERGLAPADLHASSVGDPGNLADNVDRNLNTGGAPPRAAPAAPAAAAAAANTIATVESEDVSAAGPSASLFAAVTRDSDRPPSAQAPAAAREAPHISPPPEPAGLWGLAASICALAATLAAAAVWWCVAGDVPDDGEERTLRATAAGQWLRARARCFRL